MRSRSSRHDLYVEEPIYRRFELGMGGVDGTKGRRPVKRQPTPAKKFLHAVTSLLGGD